jgi:hypothetical protein
VTNPRSPTPSKKGEEVGMGMWKVMLETRFWVLVKLICKFVSNNGRWHPL